MRKIMSLIFLGQFGFIAILLASTLYLISVVSNHPSSVCQFCSRKVCWSFIHVVNCLFHRSIIKRSCWNLSFHAFFLYAASIKFCRYAFSPAVSRAAVEASPAPSMSHNGWTAMRSANSPYVSWWNAACGRSQYTVASSKYCCPPLCKWVLSVNIRCRYVFILNYKFADFQSRLHVLKCSSLVDWHWGSLQKIDILLEDNQQTQTLLMDW